MKLSMLLVLFVLFSACAFADDCPPGTTDVPGVYPPVCLANDPGACPGSCGCPGRDCAIPRRSVLTPSAVISFVLRINTDRLNTLINSTLYVKRRVLLSDIVPAAA